MKFKLGAFLQIYNGEKSIWKKQIKVLQKISSLSHLEIWFEYFPNKDELAYLKNLISGYEIIVHAPFLGLNLCLPHPLLNEASLKILKKAMSLAEKLAAKKFVCHLGQFPFFFSKSEVIKIVRPSLRSLIQDGKKRGLKVLIENMPKSSSKKLIQFPLSFSDFSLLKKHIPEILFNLDVGHCVRNQMDYKKFLLKFLPRLCHIHLHDAKWGGKDHLEAGKGDLNFQEFFSLLKKINYQDTISLEVFHEREILNSWEKIKKLI